MPTIRERLDADLKDAMRAKDELKTSVIRMAKSAIKYKEVEGTNKVLDEAGILNVLTTMLKQRRDSIEQFTQGGRADLAEKEEKEVAIIQSYLPQQLSAAELKRRLKAVKRPRPRYATGVMAKYARLVSSASDGAVTG